MRLFLLQLIVFYCGTIYAILSLTPRDVKHIPSLAATGPVTANFVSSGGGLDEPQLSAVNSSSFEWWYFDAISPDLQTSIVIVFYTALSAAFPLLPPSDDVTVASIAATFPNGTQTVFLLTASEAVVTTNLDDSSADWAGMGMSGSWTGTGMSWSGSSDLSSYTVIVNSPANGIVGNFTLKPNALAHYSCGPGDATGTSMVSSPKIGWSNAVPDADAEIDFEIQGSPLAFTGVGYHDHNWSLQPVEDNVMIWYWGHGRLGEYSIVWADTFDLDGNEHVSAYVSKNGEIITASCYEHSVRVRPSGVDDTFLPTDSLEDSGDYTVKMVLGPGLVLHVNVTSTVVLADTGSLYTRWAGSLAGSLNGGSVITGGVALFEEFVQGTQPDMGRIL